MSDSQVPQPTPRRGKVLFWIEADGFVRAFADGADVHMAFVPDCPGHESLAEEVARLLLPPAYAKLFDESKLKATGIARKVRPSALQAARETALSIHRLNSLKPRGSK